MGTITDVNTEISNFADFLSAYDNSLSNYYLGSSATCTHFLEVVPSLSMDKSAALTFSNIGNRGGSSIGMVLNFVYEVNATTRARTLLEMNKAGYYVDNNSQQDFDSTFYSGETAKTINCVMGKNPDQGIKV